MNYTKKQISPVAPGRWVMNALGAIGGGYSGYVKARDAAEEAGEKMTFANSAASIGGGALMGGLSPMSGISKGITTGVGEATANKAERDALTAESTPGAAPGTTPASTPPVDVQSQNSSVDPNAVFPSPNSVRVGQVFDPTQDTYGSMFAI